MAQQFNTINDIKLANARAGQYWFAADTMRFFGSRVLPTLYGGRYFITSEQGDPTWPRCYTIREARPDGTVATVGDFQAYRSSEAARRAVRQLLKED